MMLSDEGHVGQPTLLDNMHFRLQTLIAYEGFCGRALDAQL